MPDIIENEFGSARMACLLLQTKAASVQFFGFGECFETFFIIFGIDPSLGTLVIVIE